MKAIIEALLKPILEKYPDIFEISNDELNAKYNEICAAIQPIIDPLSMSDYQSLFDELYVIVLDESLKAEKLKINTPELIGAFDTVVNYMREKRPSVYY